MHHGLSQRMLKKSFKPAKCKIALKLAVARIKLLKNKRDTQLKQMKRDIAQLLQSGQEQTARIRVEHVVREENTMAAYDIIELYCELIVARLSIIESQKHCPIDLQEAITSVIFASPRCADVPELLDVRNLFTAKYGKEFITSALELRPDCGVSRTIVEKLSAKAPNGETKIKILTAIAQEHNVKWDPSVAEEQILKPQEDLLNGPSKFVSASKLPMEPSDVQFPSPPRQKPGLSMKSSASDAGREPPSSNSFSTGNVSAGSTSITPPEPRRASESRTERGESKDSWYRDEAGPANRQNWDMGFKDATSAAQAAAESAERASMAARAAAKLASRDMFPRQHFAESHETPYHGSSYKEPEEPSSPVINRTGSDDSVKRDEFSLCNSREVTERKDSGRQSAEMRSGRSASSHSAINSIDDEISVANPHKMDLFYGKIPSGEIKKSNRQNSKIKKENYVREGSVEKLSSQFVSSHSGTGKFVSEALEQHFEKFGGGVDEHASISREESEIAEMRSGRFASLRSTMNSINDEISVANPRKMDGSSWKIPSEGETEIPNRQSSKIKENYIREGSVKKQSSQYVSSHSGSGKFDGEALDQNFEKYGGVKEQASMSREERNAGGRTEQLRSSNFPTPVFDDSGSDSERDLELENNNDRFEHDPYLSPPERNSLTHLSSNVNSWSPGKFKSGFPVNAGSTATQGPENDSQRPSKSPDRNPKPASWLQLNDSSPVVFDDSGSSDLENEAEIMNKSAKTEVSSLLPDPKISSHGTSLTRNNSSHCSESSLYGKKEMEEPSANLRLYSSSDDSESDDTGPNQDQPENLSVVGGSWNKYSNRDSSENVVPLKGIVSPRKSKDSVGNEFGAQLPPASAGDSEFLKRSNHESGHELNFGKLKGGLRNKGFDRPPYVWSPLADDSPTVKKKTSVSSLDKTSANSGNNSHSVEKKPGISSFGKSSTSTRPRDQKPEIQSKPQSEARKHSTLITHKSYFDSDSDEAEEEPTRPTLSRRNKPTISYRSRRTEDSSPQLETGNALRLSSKSESPVSTDYGDYNKLTQPSKPVPQTASKENLRSSQLDPAVEKPFKLLPRDETSISGENSRRNQHSSALEQLPMPLEQAEVSVSNENSKSTQLRSADEQSSRPLPKTKNLENNKSLKSSGSSVGSSSKESSVKGSSHVHPKLPDYDTLAAHFESLRSNQKSL